MKQNNLIGISGKIGSGKDTVGKIIQYLTTPKGSNEFTLQQYLEDNSSYLFAGNDYKIKKFADKLKDIVCLLIGCTREQLEDQEFKNSYLSEEWNKFIKVEYSEYEKEPTGEQIRDSDSILVETTFERLTPRKLLQLLGTECGREIIHPNIWVNGLFAEYKKSMYYMCDKCMGEDINLIQIPSRFQHLGYAEDEWVCGNCKGEESEGDLTKVVNSIASNWIITDCRFPNELKAVKDRGGITIRVNRPLPNKTEEGFSIYYAFHPSETALDKSEFDYTIDNSGTIEDLVEKVKEILIKEKIL